MSVNDRLSLDCISVLGQPPVDFIHLAADLGLNCISLGLTPLTANPHDYPKWSLRGDVALQRDVKAAMRERNVSISIAEGLFGMPNKPVSDYAADMDLLRELGVKRINFLSLDRDRARAFDQGASFNALAQERGMETHVEFVWGLIIGDLPTALDLVRHVASPNMRIAIDALHLYRSGSSAADLRALDPALVGHVQICDAPLVSKFENYGDEAAHNRLAPGDGELPLADFVAALPANCVVGIETPMLGPAQAGIGPRERLAPCVERTRALLAA